MIIQEVDIIAGGYYIYTLADERSPTDVRYVGMTASPSERYACHLYEHKREDFALWWRGVIACDASVVMRVIDVTTSQAKCQEWERAFIAMHAEYGSPLFNARGNPHYQKPEKLAYAWIKEGVRQSRPKPPPRESEYPVPPLTYCWSMTDHQKDTLGYGSDIGQRIENQQRDKMIIKTSEGWKKAKRTPEGYVWVK